MSTPERFYTQVEEAAALPGHSERSEQSKQILHYEEELGGLFHDVAAIRDPEHFPDGKAIPDSILREGYTFEDVRVAYLKESSKPGYNPVALWEKHFCIPRYVVPSAETITANSVEEYVSGMWNELTYHAAEHNGTLLPTKNPHFKPGQRYAEGYYWDTKDGIRALLLEARRRNQDERLRKEELAKGVANNLAQQIQEFGFVPNGQRSYYLGRSQPPMFTNIVKEMDAYFNKDEDGKDLPEQSQGWPDLIEHYLPWIVKEYEWWMRGEDAAHRGSGPVALERVIHMGDGLILNRHWDSHNKPRLESYQEDLETAARNPEIDPTIIYRHLRACAEFGRDFTARHQTDPERLETIHTTDFVVPELNALLYEYETFIAEAYKNSGRSNLQAEFEERAERRKLAIDTYLWDPYSGSYKDFDFVAWEQSRIISMGAAYPVARGAASPEQAKLVAKVLGRDLLKVGGFVGALIESPQQWDSPNGFPIDQIEGVEALLIAGEDRLAMSAMRRWLRRDEEVFRQCGSLVEKHNVVSLEAKPGGGGEYPVQRGFLWTNGVNVTFRHKLRQLGAIPKAA